MAALTSLEDLLARLRAGHAEGTAYLHADKLAMPAFGGEKPVCRLDVWSWDPARILLREDGALPRDFGFLILDQADIHAFETRRDRPRFRFFQLDGAVYRQRVGEAGVQAVLDAETLAWGAYYGPDRIRAPVYGTEIADPVQDFGTLVLRVEPLWREGEPGAPELMPGVTMGPPYERRRRGGLRRRPYAAPDWFPGMEVDG